MKRRVPCKTCPWRKSTRTEAIPGGGLDHALAATVHGDLVTVDNVVVSGLTVMQCHCSTHACAGYMVQVGYDSIGVRLAGLDVRAYSSGGAELHEDMAALLAAHPDTK